MKKNLSFLAVFAVIISSLFFANFMINNKSEITVGLSYDYGRQHAERIIHNETQLLSLFDEVINSQNYGDDWPNPDMVNTIVELVSIESVNLAVKDFDGIIAVLPEIKLIKVGEKEYRVKNMLLFQQKSGGTIKYGPDKGNKIKYSKFWIGVEEITTLAYVPKPSVLEIVFWFIIIPHQIAPIFFIIIDLGVLYLLTNTIYAYFRKEKGVVKKRLKRLIFSSIVYALLCGIMSFVIILEGVKA